MPDHYSEYGVLSERDSPSWDDAMRRVVHARVAVTNTPRFLDIQRWQTLWAVCERIVPQPSDRVLVPVAALIDRKLINNDREGYRRRELPPLREAWQRGLAALNVEAVAVHGRQFHLLEGAKQDELLTAMQDGKLTCIEWSGMPSGIFFSDRLARDIVSTYYSHLALRASQNLPG